VVDMRFFGWHPRCGRRSKPPASFPAGRTKRNDSEGTYLLFLCDLDSFEAKIRQKRKGVIFFYEGFSGAGFCRCDEILSRHRFPSGKQRPGFAQMIVRQMMEMIGK